MASAAFRAARRASAPAISSLAVRPALAAAAPAGRDSRRNRRTSSASTCDPSPSATIVRNLSFSLAGSAATQSAIPSSLTGTSGALASAAASIRSSSIFRNSATEASDSLSSLSPAGTGGSTSSSRSSSSSSSSPPSCTLSSHPR